MSDNNRFRNITFEDFRAMSEDESLSRHEKIGFPDIYREGKSAAILADMSTKIAALNDFDKIIADIGCGCGDLASALITHCAEHRHQLLLFDSAEVLAQLPSPTHVVKINGRFPQESADKSNYSFPAVDAVIAYSMLHYVFAESCIFSFLDEILSMLAPGGHLLLGDIPNISMRRRFFASATGKNFHRIFTVKE